MNLYSTEALNPIQMPLKYDHIAPGGSEIRELCKVSHGSMSHCTLNSVAISRATTHKSIEEIWCCISGKGVIWRKYGNYDESIDVLSGTSFIIPCGVIFQFRNTRKEELCFIIATMPPWPGSDEAKVVKGKWNDI